MEKNRMRTKVLSVKHNRSQKSVTVHLVLVGNELKLFSQQIDVNWQIMQPTGNVRNSFLTDVLQGFGLNEECNTEMTSQLPAPSFLCSALCHIYLCHLNARILSVIPIMEEACALLSVKNPNSFKHVKIMCDTAPVSDDTRVGIILRWLNCQFRAFKSIEKTKDKRQTTNSGSVQKDLSYFCS